MKTQKIALAVCAALMLVLAGCEGDNSHTESQKTGSDDRAGRTIETNPGNATAQELTSRDSVLTEILVSSTIRNYAQAKGNLPEKLEDLRGSDWFLIYKEPVEPSFQLVSEKVLEFTASATNHLSEDAPSRRSSSRITAPDLSVSEAERSAWSRPSSWNARDEFINSGANRAQYRELGKARAYVRQIRWMAGVYSMVHGKFPESWSELKSFLEKHGYEVRQEQLQAPLTGGALTIGSSEDDAIRMWISDQEGQSRLQFEWTELPDEIRVPSIWKSPDLDQPGPPSMF